MHHNGRCIWRQLTPPEPGWLPTGQQSTEQCPTTLVIHAVAPIYCPQYRAWASTSQMAGAGLVAWAPTGHSRCKGCGHVAMVGDDSPLHFLTDSPRLCWEPVSGSRGGMPWPRQLSLASPCLKLRRHTYDCALQRQGSTEPNIGTHCLMKTHTVCDGATGCGSDTQVVAYIFYARRAGSDGVG